MPKSLSALDQSGATAPILDRLVPSVRGLSALHVSRGARGTQLGPVPLGSESRETRTGLRNETGSQTICGGDWPAFHAPLISPGLSHAGSPCRPCRPCGRLIGLLPAVLAEVAPVPESPACASV